MALSFPLSAAAFMDILEVETATLLPMWNQETSENGAALLVADLGPAKWSAELTTVSLPHDDAEAIMALIDSLGGGLRTFYLYDTRRFGPREDPDGTIYGASTPEVDAVADSYNLSIAGLPAGYQIKHGDRLSIAYGYRTYLGKFTEDGTADGSGDLASIGVAPPLPAGVTSGDDVSLVKSQGLFKMVPNSAYPSSVTTVHQKITFKAKQTHEEA